MTRLEVRPFSDEFLPHAAELLAARHRAHRAAEPLLPARFEKAEAAAAEVEPAREARGPRAPSRFAARASSASSSGRRRATTIWGANVWVEAAGHAVEVAEDLRDLYGAAAARWVEEGRDRHYASSRRTDPALLEAWSRVSFGQQHAYGIREVPDVTWPEGVRRAEERDSTRSSSWRPLLQDHQSLAPVFGGGLPQETEEELRAGLFDDLQKPEIGDLVAEQDGRIVGAFQIVPVELSSVHVGLARPDGAAFLGWAATRPGRSGLGSWPGTRRRRVCLGARARVRDDGDRLAGDQPARLAFLACARLPGELPPALPADSLAGEAA